MGFGPTIDLVDFLAAADNDLGKAMNDAIATLQPFAGGVYEGATFPEDPRQRFTAPWGVPVLVVPPNPPRFGDGGKLIAPRPDDLHSIGTQVVVPGDVAVVITGAGGVSSVGIRNDIPGEPYPFVVEHGQRPVQLRNLLLWKGGVVLGAYRLADDPGTDEERPSGKGIGVFGCAFVHAPRWAIRSPTWPAVGIEISDCTFRASRFGDIFVERAQSDLWLIENCQFLEGFGTNIRLRTTGTRIVNCDFEQRLRPTPEVDCDEPPIADGPLLVDQSVNAPYLHLDVAEHPTTDKPPFGAQGDTVVAFCRFGNEHGKRGGVSPTEVAVIGPTGEMHGGVAGHVSFTQCKFVGDARLVLAADNGNVALCDHDRTAVLALRSAVAGVSLVGCDILPDGYAYLVREDAFDASSPTTPVGTPKPLADRQARLRTMYAQTFGNSIVGHVPLQRVAVFSRGGHGWSLAPQESRLRPTSQGATFQNLVTRSANPGVWKASVTAEVTQEAGLVAGTHSALIKRKGTENAPPVAVTGALSSPLDGPAVLSVWAKSDGGHRLAMQLQSNHAKGTRALGGANQLIQLTPTWERYWVQLGSVHSASAPLVSFHLVPVVDESAGTEEPQQVQPTMEIWGPQVERGWGEPSPFVPNPVAGGASNVHAAIPHQGLILGTAVIGYGPTPPSAGRHAVGDISVNTAPAVAGDSWIGWICVVAGAPGTWRPFGQLGPVL